MPNAQSVTVFNLLGYSHCTTYTHCSLYSTCNLIRAPPCPPATLFCDISNVQPGDRLAGRCA